MFKVKIYTKLYGLGGENGCLVFISLFFPFLWGHCLTLCLCLCVFSCPSLNQSQNAGP